MSAFRQVAAATLALSAASMLAAETITYTYDPRGRLTNVARSGGVAASYTYDLADNRQNVTVTGPSFSVNDVSATEGSPLVFTVTRTATTTAMSVSYATSNGTATAGSDYTAASGTLNFAVGEASKPVSVSTTDDTASESAETVILTLSNPVGAAILDGTGLGTINDNDAPPACAGVSFSIASNGAVTEGANSVFTVTKSGTATGSCSVNYATANGTAVAGSDYTAKSGTLTFTTAQTSQTISVVSTDDSVVESAETFSMALSSPTGGATLGTAAATASINDNDGVNCAGISFAVNDVAVVEGTPLVFTITKAGSTSSTCSVNYASTNNTAIAPSDFAAISGTLNFASNQSSLTVSTSTVVAGPNEGTETMYLDLSGANGGATIADSRGIGTIYNDDGGGCLTCRSVSDSAQSTGTTDSTDPPQPPPE